MADLAHLNMDSAANGSNGNGSATDLPFGVKESVAKSNVKTRSMIEQCSGMNCIYKNRSSRKTDSQGEKRSSQIPILLKIVNENRFSGKTYFYTIASRVLRHAGVDPPGAAAQPGPVGAVPAGGAARLSQGDGEAPGGVGPGGQGGNSIA